MASTHPWKFVFSGIDLVMAKMKNSGYVMTTVGREYLQNLLIDSGYFSDPRFTWVGLSVLYGLKNDEKAKFEGISKKYQDLSMVRELDMRVLLTADENDVDMLMDFFKIAALDSLIEAGKKYKLNPAAIEILQKERNKLGVIPDWEYEMEEHPEILLDMYRKSKPLVKKK